MEMHGWTENQSETILEWTHDYFHIESVDAFMEKWSVTKEQMPLIFTLGTEVIPAPTYKHPPQCGKDGCNYPRKVD